MDTVEQNDMPRWLTIFLSEVKRALNNGLNFSDNFDGRVLEVTFSAANSDQIVNTGLRRIPQNYIVINRSANMTVYNGNAASSVGTIYLRSSAVGTARLLIF